MDDVDIFSSLASSIFAKSVESDRKIRLIGFRLGNLEVHQNRQSKLNFIDE